MPTTADGLRRGRSSARGGATGGGPDMSIERVGPMDLTVLAADRASVPMNLGAVLVFDEPGPPPAELLGRLRERISRIPRLRQVLRRPPLGCGRPVWVDDPSFTPDRHVE